MKRDRTKKKNPLMTEAKKPSQEDFNIKIYYHTKNSDPISLSIASL